MRTRLREARRNKGLTQQQLGDLVGVQGATVSRWESGKEEPDPQFIPLVYAELATQDPQLFEHFPDVPKTMKQAPQQIHPSAVCRRSDSCDTLDSSELTDIQQSEIGSISMDKGRRNTINLVAGTLAASTIAESGLTLVNTVQVITGPAVEHDAYIDAVEGNIGTWWQWLRTGGNDSELQAKLNIHVPVLRQIATSNSSYQQQAASLAVEAKIMQIALANDNPQFAQRESHCKDAVKMGALSGDTNLLALAQFWYGDTFTYCYNQPETAIELLNNALSNVDGNALIATRIYSDLSIAHAQNHDETNALDSIEMACSAMPSHPVQSPLYRFGTAELNQMEGKVYLYLAEHLNSRSYAQDAYNLFNKSISQQARSKDMSIQALIRKADASRLLGKKDECVDSLTKSLALVPTAHKLTQINGVLARVPDSWQREDDVEELQKDVDNALVMAGR